MVRDMHVMMFPWSAFGHMIPFLQLSVSLARSGIQVSFVSTTNNINRLPKLPQDIAAPVNLVGFPLPSRGALPEGAEASIDIPFEKIQDLKEAYDLLQSPFKQLINDQRPDWIICDGIPHWLVEIAAESRIPLIHFSVFSAATLSWMGPPEYLTGEGLKRVRPSPESLTSPPPWVNFPSKVAYRGYEAGFVHAGLFGKKGSATADCERIATVLGGCQAVAVRSCKEIEGEYLNLVEKILGKPVIPVGSLPPERPKGVREITDQSWTRIFKWLDEQEPRSVVFVGFGSECKLSREQVYEIANGVELSELPFLWALREPDWAMDDLDNALPPRFGDRTSGKGLVHIGWAPQTEILAHPSIGGCLFHSGWGSVIETLEHGHSLVVLPFIVDQSLNASLLVEKDLAIEVQRSEDGSFSKEGIAKSLRQAMQSEALKARAREAAAIFGDRKLHDQYMAEFVDYLKNGANNRDKQDISQ